jgi:hypothetical protein
MSTTVPPPVVPQSPPAHRRSRRLQHPELAAAIAAVVGIFATAVGAGIGVRHVTKTGFTTTSVLGSLCSSWASPCSPPQVWSPGGRCIGGGAWVTHRHGCVLWIDGARTARLTARSTSDRVAARRVSDMP